jgi:hypothetical protein
MDTYNFSSLFSISANDEQNGILWAVRQSYRRGTGTDSSLHAFNATNLEPLYMSAPPRDAIDPATHLTLPMVANGKVYVGTRDNVTVMGLFSKLQATLGNHQTGHVGATLPKALRVKVSNAYTGNAMPAVTINFSDSGSGGSFSNPNPVTNGEGVALTSYTLPGKPGVYKITASSTGFTTAHWTESATEGVARR